MSTKKITMIEKAKRRLFHSLPCMRPGTTLRRHGKYGFIGDYKSWSEAQRDSSGYDSEIILEKTTEASLKVRNGEAPYERDSAIFGVIQYSWPLLAGLMWIAALSEGKLNVLDFGGALGTSYYQNRVFLKEVPFVRWNIVEQPHYVERGRTLFQNDALRFYSSIGECLHDTSPQVIVMSGVLQYVKDPYGLLGEVFEHELPFTIIDRTPFQNQPVDRLCVQRVSPEIFEASYPAWIFSLNRFRDALSPNRIIAEFDSFENGALYGADFKGFIIGNRKASHGESFR